ncbi:hypothetical protein E3N88_10766 [Mikania micrantha]|uniref:J domain-containing protein n=1 Tax=Mikania micrantha TaxID=192012 RepID=A0A5N6PBP2_9ASTR|nr:hypothetical protein E3N88_10766 [Mikania micrantha]
MTLAEVGASSKELYASLHVWPEASDEAIRKAYRQWAQITISRNTKPHRFVGLNRRAGISIELILGSDYSVAVGWRKKEQKMAATGAIQVLLC